MAGCYGNSAHDRYYENMLDDYLNGQEPPDECSCDFIVTTNEIGIQQINIDKYGLYDLCDLYSNEKDNYICPVCDNVIPQEDIDQSAKENE